MPIQLSSAYRELFDCAPLGIILIDQNGAIVCANKEACRIHGYVSDQLVGKNIHALERTEQLQHMSERLGTIRTAGRIAFNTHHIRKDGAPIFLNADACVITIDGEAFVQIIYKDTGEQTKLLEEQLHLQKHDAVAVMAGGLAHEFNNALATISSQVEVIREENSFNERAFKSLGIVENEAIKARTICSKLFEYAQQTPAEVFPVVLNNVIKDTVLLLENIFRDKIKVAQNLDVHLTAIKGDANQLEKVFMALIKNACEAMPRGGTVTIETENIVLPRDMYPGKRHEVAPINYVQVTVQDTGIGIPQKYLEKIFEPFFTTKERSQNPGLGLSMCYGVIHNHGGRIWAQSKQGEGAAIYIMLPA